jgi:hypothetical protein
MNPERDVATRTPRWVKVFGLVALAVAVGFVVLLLAGRGGHGPGRHSSGDGGGNTRASSFVQHSEQLA